MRNPQSSVVIVGGKGMLANALAQSLQRRGVSLAAVDLPEYDITREQSIRDLFAKYRPTLLFNPAAHTKVDLCEEEEEKATAVNGHAVGMLAQACADHGTKMVHVSTDFVFDGRATRPYRTDDQPNPLSAYGRSKLAGEQALQKVNPPGWIIARTAWLYGRRGASFPRTMIERARAGQPLSVVDDQVGSPSYTVDVAEAMVDLADCNAQGIFHVTNTGQTSWFGFAQATLQAFGLATDLAPISTADYFKMRPKSAIRPAYSVLDTAAFTRAVGRPMRPWQQALQDYHEAVEREGL